ncbi:hypothetical protein SDC9_131909 [bioreactor metagenome]|uniref:Uncharacterized protein n=1 Tax=bioreactor metagenome TaxID=1076179 RepID=A0A645D7A7_9ZZZZ
MVVLDTIPFTLEVRMFPEEIRELVVAGIIEASEVVAKTPFTVELRMSPARERVLEAPISAYVQV